MNNSIAIMGNPVKPDIRHLVGRRMPLMTPTELFARNVKATLEARGLSAAALARRTKVPTRTLYNVISERSSPSLETAQEVARALRVEVWQLLHPDYTPGKPPRTLVEEDIASDLLADVLQGVDMALEARGSVVSVEKRAVLAAMAYRWAVVDGQIPTPNRLKELARLAV